MERLKRAVILTRLVQKLRENGSWCGETHVQKAVFFLQELTEAPFGFSFILYKHGPFSFDLRDELTALRADGLLMLEPQAPPYGPRLAATEAATRLQQQFPKTLKSCEKALDFVAQEIGDKAVTQLEQIATALFVTRRKPRATIEERLEVLARLKPHIARPEAQNALRKAEALIERVRACNSFRLAL